MPYNMYVQITVYIYISVCIYL
jgi:hypothetical protein